MPTICKAYPLHVKETLASWKLRLPPEKFSTVVDKKSPLNIAESE